MIGSAFMRLRYVCLVLAAVGCNDHRFGFFGDKEDTESGETETTSGPETTTVSPTTVSPTVPTTDPTVGPTSGPGTITITSEPTTFPPTDPTIDPTSDTDGTQCGEQVLPPIAPVSVSGSNAGLADLFVTPCIPSFGPDAVWLWSAPSDGEFVFDTINSGIDTVLTVYDGVCGGPALGCNDDSEQLWSSVTTKLAGGTTVTIVVEGLSGATGPIELNIRPADMPPPPSCAVNNLGSALGFIDASTQDGVNAEASACGGSESPEVVFMWQAPFPGLFVFRTTGSDFDPVVYVRRGDCEGEELGCSDDFIDGLEASVQLQLGPEDGPVFIFVDGALGSAGKFTLAIEAQ